jgi:hypothetical protein
MLRANCISNGSFVDNLINVISFSEWKFGNKHHSEKMRGESTITGKSPFFTMTVSGLFAPIQFMLRPLDLQSGRKSPQS